MQQQQVCTGIHKWYKCYVTDTTKTILVNDCIIQQQGKKVAQIRKLQNVTSIITKIIICRKIKY